MIVRSGNALLVGAVLALAACGGQPRVNTLNKAADQQADTRACKQQASQFAAPARSANYSAPASPSKTYSPGAEDRAFEACMRARGWR